MKTDNAIPKFIQQIIIPINNTNQAQLSPSIEIGNIFLALLKKGLGIWKVDSDECYLVIEGIKNYLQDSDIKLIEEHKVNLFHFLDKDKKYYPLSFSQKMMCVQSELFKNASYQLPIPFYLNRELSITFLEEALQSVVKRQEILRAIFPKLQQTWIQVILPEVPCKITFQDFRNLNSLEQKQKISTVIHAENTARFSIETGPLFRLTCLQLNDSKYVLILTVHHAIFDGLSFPVFIDELMKHYEGLIQNSNPSVPTLTAQYPHFVLEQYSIPDSIRTREIDWWSDYLNDVPEQSLFPFPTQSKQKNISDFKSDIVPLTFTSAEYLLLKEFCKKINISMSLFFMGGIFLLLHQFTQQTDIVIGTILNKRNRVDYENLIGDFNNIVPVRMKIGTQSSAEFLKLVQQSFFATFSHQKITFDELLKHLKIKRNTNNLPLYNIFLDSINFDVTQNKIKNSAIELFTEEDIAPRIVPLMDLFFLLIQKSGHLTLYSSFSSILNKTTVTDLLQTLKKILLQIIQNPTIKINQYHTKNVITPSPAIKSKRLLPVIVCLPGADGQVALFSRLTKKISAHRIYAIKYKEPSAGNIAQSIETIADNFIDIITSLHPVDDSILLGLSSGGIVAFEIIQKLSKRGFSYINKLILLDSFPPNTKNSKLYQTQFNRFQHQNDDDFLLLLINFSIKYFNNNKQMRITAEEFHHLTQPLDFREKEQYVYDWIKNNTWMLLPPFNQFKNWIRRLKSNLIAIVNYEAEPFIGDMQVSYIAADSNENPFNLLISSENPLISIDKKVVWSNLFPLTKIDFKMMPNSDHYSMLAGKNVQILEDILLTCLTL